MDVPKPTGANLNNIYALYDDDYAAVRIHLRPKSSESIHLGHYNDVT